MEDPQSSQEILGLFEVAEVENTHRNVYSWQIPLHSIVFFDIHAIFRFMPILTGTVVTVAVAYTAQANEWLRFENRFPATSLSDPHTEYKFRLYVYKNRYTDNTDKT